MDYNQPDEGNMVGDILSAIERMDTATLKETLAYLLKVYVIDKGLSYEGYVAEETAREQETPKTFAELVMSMKERFPMEELRAFQVEGQSVFITIDGKKMRIGAQRPSNQESGIDRTITPNPQIQNKGKPPDTKTNGRFGKLELE